MANSPTLIQGFAQMLDSRLEALHVAMPGRVESYDASQQRAAVKPLIRRAAISEDDTRVAESLPVIEGVPVIFPGAGAFKITFPISKGDIVWLVFGEGSLDKWLDKGGSDVDPDDDRRNALSDAVAIPGILPFSDASDQTADGAMVLSGAEIRAGSKDATDPVVLKSEFDTLQAKYDTHTHLDPVSGSTGVTSNLWGVIVGALKLKGE